MIDLGNYKKTYTIYKSNIYRLKFELHLDWFSLSSKYSPQQPHHQFQGRRTPAKSRNVTNSKNWALGGTKGKLQIKLQTQFEIEQQKCI